MRQNRVNVVLGDIKEIDNYFPKADFNVVTCNPPYMIDCHGIQNPDSPKAIARHEILCNMDDVARAASIMLKPGGRLYLIHRPFRLVEIFTTLTKYRLEPKRMRFVHPYADKEPNMVLIEACFNGKSRITIEKPLIVPFIKVTIKSLKLAVVATLAKDVSPKDAPTILVSTILYKSCST